MSEQDTSVQDDEEVEQLTEAKNRLEDALEEVEHIAARKNYIEAETAAKDIEAAIETIEEVSGE